MNKKEADPVVAYLVSRRGIPDAVSEIYNESPLMNGVFRAQVPTERMELTMSKTEAFVLIDLDGEPVSATATKTHIVFSSDHGIFVLSRQQLQDLLEWAE